MNAMNMVISLWTAHTKYLPQNTSNTSQDIQGSPCQIDFKASLGRLRKKNPVQITVPLPKTLQLESLQFTEATLDHNNRIDTATTEAAQDILAQHIEDTATDPAMTHNTGHITDHPHIAAL